MPPRTRYIKSPRTTNKESSIATKALPELPISRSSFQAKRTEPNQNKEANMDTNSSSFNSGGWTNEKHLHYLKSMEASFVHTMFENNNNNNNNGRVVHTMFENNGRLLRLDRYLPDTSDSTLDLKTTHQRRKKKHAAAAAVAAASTTASGSRADKRFTGRRSYQPYASSQDQVVPQIGNRGGYKDESDSSDASSK